MRTRVNNATKIPGRFVGDEKQAELLYSELRFLALDEAQFADKQLPNTFPGSAGSTKRSALAALFNEVTTLNAHFLLSGTSLGIVSSYRVLSSGFVAKSGAGSRLLGITRRA